MIELFHEFRELVQSLPLLRGLVAAIWMAGLLWAFERRAALSRGGKIALGGLVGLQALGGLAINVKATLTNFVSPREWDFFCFWLYGRALAQGDSPYDIDTLRKLAAPLAASEDFLGHMYCLYPPPCLLQFWLLGHLPLQISMGVWYFAQWLALAGVVYLLWRLLDNQRTWLGLTVTLALVLSLDSTRSTLFYAQSTLLILLVLLAYVNTAQTPLSGAWLGLAILVKPIAAIQVLDLALRRQWRQVIAMGVPVLLATGAFLGMQGKAGFDRYLTNNPVRGEVRDIHYLETMNQSLLSTLLRWGDASPGKQPVFYPPFIVAAGVLTATTVLVLLRLPRDCHALGAAYMLTLALLVYPGSLKHYTVLLLLPYGVLWLRRKQLLGGPLLVIAGIAATFGLVWSGLEFQANLAAWLLMTCLLAGSCHEADETSRHGAFTAA